jgi:hypothetical protein
LVVNGLDRARLTTDGADPSVAMEEAAAWVTDVERADVQVGRAAERGAGLGQGSKYQYRKVAAGHRPVLVTRRRPAPSSTSLASATCRPN